jgi:hypothetical protein
MIDFDLYTKLFQSSIASLDKTAFDRLGVQLSVGHVLESVALKAYKPGWSSSPTAPVNADAKIFFSIWVNEKAVKENKLLYNIHALKLSRLSGYKIASRKFAQSFREQFMDQQKSWPNVDIDFGPATLMQGWLPLNPDTTQGDVQTLLTKFLEIVPIIDRILYYNRK